MLPSGNMNPWASETIYFSVLTTPGSHSCLTTHRSPRYRHNDRKSGYRLAELSPWPGGFRTRWMTTSRFREEPVPDSNLSREPALPGRFHVVYLSGVLDK